MSEFSVLRDYVRSIANPGVIAIEGFTGSGKSHLADALGSELCFPVIHTDEYVIGDDESLPYPDRLDYARLRLTLDGNGSGTVALFDGICARESLRRLNVRANHFIYVKRIGENGLWYDGFHLEDFETEQAVVENNEQPHLSDFRYHVAERPHENADVIFERVERHVP